VTFDDGLAGEIACSRADLAKPVFAPLADPAFFAAVAIGRGGRSLGWRLEDLGDEVDRRADATRIEIETRMVEGRERLPAAE
jgi:hypothetical protein